MKKFFVSNPLLSIIIISSLIRCIIGNFVELGNDEVYYWTYALRLDASYFDHPPLIAYLIRSSTFNLQFNQEIFVRLVAIIGSAFNTWLIYKITFLIKNKRAGLYAALLYTSSFYTSIICGLFILPDSPQVVFWLLSIYLMIKIFILKTEKKSAIIFLGITIGFCALSKISGLYLWFAAGLFILFFDRKQLSNAYLWLSIAITLIIISPVLYWNIQNHFITYTYQSGRLSTVNGISFSSFFAELLGEIFYHNPINYFLYASVIIITAFYSPLIKNRKLHALLLLLSLPIIILFWLISFFNNILPHWSGPGFIALIILTAYYLDEIYSIKKTYVYLSVANLFILIIVIAGFFCINYLPVQFGSKKISDLGANDFTLDMYGWKKFSSEFDSLYSADLKNGIMKNNAVIISNKWFPASHIYYYVAYPNKIKLYAAGALFDIHNYAWLNKLNGNLELGTDAYFISPSNYNVDAMKVYKNNFDEISDQIIFSQYRGGKMVRQFNIYRMKNYKGGLNLSVQ
ncbi:MAG: ArnT family glycosyltransferase [Chitinophagaceae bacterium]